MNVVLCRRANSTIRRAVFAASATRPSTNLRRMLLSSPRMLMPYLRGTHIADQDDRKRQVKESMGAIP